MYFCVLLKKSVSHEDTSLFSLKNFFNLSHLELVSLHQKPFTCLAPWQWFLCWCKAWSISPLPTSRISKCTQGKTAAEDSSHL